MAFQLVNSRQTTVSTQYAQFYIDALVDLASLPQMPTDKCCMGSVAYTATYDIYTLTNNGWVDDNGTVVSG